MRHRPSSLSACESVPRATARRRVSAEVGASAGGCPFAAMIPGTEDAQRGQAAGQIPVRWTAAAEARLAKVPEFVRPMARAGIERFARDNGCLEVDEQILEAAREFFGM